MLRQVVRGFAVSAGLIGISLAAIVVVLTAWPTDTADVLGVPIEVGAQQPSGDFGWHGPGVLETFGQPVDLRAVDVAGPVRPFLGTTIGPYDMIRIATTTGAAQQAGDALVEAFARWALLRTPVVLFVGLALFVAIAALLSFGGWVRPLRREAWRRYLMWAGGTSVVVAAVWGASLAAAAAGSQSLARVTSIEDVFDYDVLRTSPAPAGTPRTGYDVVVIGDSRVATFGGDPLPRATPEDATCERSRNSLAEQLEVLVPAPGVRALNLACAGATVEEGLLQSQLVAGRRVPAQLGQLKLVQSPRVVVVSVGPNDVYWGPIVGSCYVTTCNVSALGATVNSLFADFARSYDDLLAELDQLDPAPQVIVIGSYEPFAPGASCADTRLPDGDGSLSQSELDTIADWRARLNEVLADGAVARSFTYIQPRLLGLCAPDATGLGPDVWPLASEYRFHPTSVGVLKTAAAVADAIDPERLTPAPADPEAAADPAAAPTG